MVSDKVISMMLTCWPLLALMLLMSVVASVLVWLLVSSCISTLNLAQVVDQLHMKIQRS